MLVQDPIWQGVQWVENQPKLYYVNMFCFVFLSLLSNYFLYSVPLYLITVQLGENRPLTLVKVQCLQTRTRSPDKCAQHKYYLLENALNNRCVLFKPCVHLFEESFQERNETFILSAKKSSVPAPTADKKRQVLEVHIAQFYKSVIRCLTLYPPIHWTPLLQLQLHFQNSWYTTKRNRFQ